jgi:hypothetical protein
VLGTLGCPEGFQEGRITFVKLSALYWVEEKSSMERARARRVNSKIAKK